MCPGLIFCRLLSLATEDDGSVKDNEPVEPETCIDSNGTGNVSQCQLLKEELDAVRRELELLKIANKELESTREVPLLKVQLHVVRHELELLRITNEELTEKCEKLENDSFSWDNMKNNEESVIFYTGLPSRNVFIILLNLFDDIDINYFYGWEVKKFSRADQMLMTLIKLRQNTPWFMLAQMFHCSVATVTNVVTTWIYLLHTILFKNFMKKIPSRTKNRACLPSCFNDFANCRMVLDCTEVTIAIPESIEAQRLTYSPYKHRNTGKGLIVVAPNGVITYASTLYPGCASDKEIVRHSKVLSHSVAGDLILADKGFLLDDIVPPDVAFNIPPFLCQPQFTPSQILTTKSIVRARIHVERAIRRVKTFRILDMIPHQMRIHASVIFQTCAALTNMKPPLIAEVEYLYKSAS